jgi:hypothetical protein
MAILTDFLKNCSLLKEIFGSDTKLTIYLSLNDQWWNSICEVCCWFDPKNQ